MSDPGFPFGAEPSLGTAADLRCRRIVDLDLGGVWGVEVASHTGSASVLERAIESVPSIHAVVGDQAVVSVDVSPRRVERPSFVSEIAGMLRAAAVEPSALMLEISERPAFVDLDGAAAQLEELHAMGVRLALDNWGEGFASLQSLRRLPLDVVKLPRSLVVAANEDAEAAALVSAMLRLAKSTGLEAVATGVQTATLADALRGLGCRLVQGPMFPDVRQPTTRAPAPDPAPPLSIEPILGWRVWSLHDVDGSIRIGSITRPDVWPACEAFHATCVGGSHGPRVPSESCTCGIYATSSPEDLALSGVFSTSASVVGAIEMWGTVVEHEHGARSQVAYPSRLRLACATCLNEGRGVVTPSVVVGSGSSIAAHCRRHAIGRTGPHRKAVVVEAALRSDYGVDLLPLERVATALKHQPGPRTRSDLRRILEKVAEGVFMVLGAVINVVMAIWVASSFLFFAFWVVASIVGVFVGSD